MSSRTRPSDLTLADHFLVRFGAFWQVTSLRRCAKVVDDWRTGLKDNKNLRSEIEGGHADGLFNSEVLATLDAARRAQET